jgi:hypothetical protein
MRAPDHNPDAPNQSRDRKEEVNLPPETGPQRTTGRFSISKANRSLTVAALIRVWTVTLLAAAVYLGIPAAWRGPAAEPDKYVLLARSFLDLRLDLPEPPRDLNELAPDDAGRWYVVYPPLPGLVLMPLVAVGMVSMVTWPITALAAALNVFLFDLLIIRLSGFWLRLRRPVNRLLLTLLFAFGTMAWSVALMGRDWQLAHTLGVTFFLLAMLEHTGRRRWLLVGMWLALAGGCRPTMLLAGLYFCVAWYTSGGVYPLCFENRRDKPGGSSTSGGVYPLRFLNRRCEPGGSLVRFAVGPVCLVVVLMALNWARFGSPADFGYERMILQSPGREMLETYGQFNWRLIPNNFYWFYLAPPTLRQAPDGATHLVFDPRGMSMFIATPAFLLIFFARLRRPIVRAAWCGILPCAIVLMMYFNTGYVQFGHRFGMDYLPLLMVLMAAAVPRRPTMGFVLLVVLSILIQSWGVGGYVGWWGGMLPLVSPTLS